MVDPRPDPGGVAVGGALEAMFQAADRAAREGRPAEAARVLREILARSPDHPRALNALGNRALADGDARTARALFERATARDPQAAPLWLNLSAACAATGDDAAQLAAIDRALGVDPYLFPALLQKVRLLAALGRGDVAAQTARGLLSAYPPAETMPAEMRQGLAEARQVVAAAGERRAAAIRAPLAAAAARHPGADLSRVARYVDQLLGRTPVYVQQPTQGHFPFLPAFEFFDEALFPWFGELEAATGAIRRELAERWTEGEGAPVPYVAFAPGMPVNQWADLNHSPRWGAYFLWRDGVRQEDNIARCPATARLIEGLPLLDLPGKGPTAMFSILEPGTRIPPHVGSTNVRTTVHLPLVVPGGCGFRVGGETRMWQEGRAWAFDDTIEHEAWNDSEQPRAILILDCWNPLLSEAERDAIRASGG